MSVAKNVPGSLTVLSFDWDRRTVELTQEQI